MSFTVERIANHSVLLVTHVDVAKTQTLHRWSSVLLQALLMRNFVTFPTSNRRSAVRAQSAIVF